jgi:transcriptional regulator with PAS, ATPase and Fis domain
MAGDTTRGTSPIPTASGVATWSLVVVGNGLGLRAVPLPAAGELVVGRDVECDVVLDHDRVSRRHARIRIAGELTIEDLGSRNGTDVGGTIPANQPHSIAAGDGIRIGPFTLVLARDVAPSAPASSLVVEDPTGATMSPMLVSVARSEVNVLVRGESGVGKEVLAQTLHRVSGRTGKLSAVNCAAIAPELLESELFGHERGAFTGAVAPKPGLLEVAARGTVLLDEIGDMPLALQAKLLRAVDAREVYRVGATRPTPLDIRFVSATHRDLFADIDSGTFRLDLFYRLAGITLEIPPLRARRGRIVALATDLLAGRGASVRFTATATARLQEHGWPGNVRELRNVLDRGLVLANGATIDAAHILFDGPAASARPASAPVALDAGGADERKRIVAALERCSGNQTRAAKLLGISRSTLATKLAILRIPRPRK